MNNRHSQAAAEPATVNAAIDSVRAGIWTTADLVRLNHAIASMGKNTTSILGQYGEELVAAAFGGVIEGFATKAYDVTTPSGEQLQVKTFSVGKSPGRIRSFGHDVVTLAIDPASAAVHQARRYKARNLYEAFKTRFDDTYSSAGFAWKGGPDDRFDRGWSIAAKVPYDDITELFARL